MGLSDWYREQAEKDQAEILDWLRSPRGALTMAVIAAAFVVYLVLAAVTAVF